MSSFRVISLCEGSSYETLHSYVSAAVARYFKSFVREVKVADFGDRVENSTFLNALQNRVFTINVVTTMIKFIQRQQFHQRDHNHHFNCLHQFKLDGVGPVDNRPSTDSLHHLITFLAAQSSSIPLVVGPS